MEGNNGRDNSLDFSRGKKYHYRDDNSYLQEGRNNKLPSYAEDFDPLDMFEKLLLCPGTKFGCHDEFTVCPFSEAIQTTKYLQQNEQPRGSKVGRSLGKKQERRTSKVEVVDLRILLTQFAQAVANNNSRAADELLKRNRKQSSPYGDGMERLAHYFANALQACLTGTGTTLYSLHNKQDINC